MLDMLEDFLALRSIPYARGWAVAPVVQDARIIVNAYINVTFQSPVPEKGVA